MQKKFNILLWCLIPIMFFFVLGFTIWNQNTVRKYQYSWKENNHTIQVSVFAKGTRDWEPVWQYMKKTVKVKDDIKTAMYQIKTLLNTDSYIIQIDENVMVGKYYQSGKYQVATTFSDDTLFKIFELENQTMMVKMSSQEEFDKLIVIGDLDTADETVKLLEKRNIEDGKDVVTKQNNHVSVYWLQGDQKVASIIEK